MLSVIILSYNTKDITLECLKRLGKPEKGLEVIVVDNKSSDGSAEAIKNNFPEARLVANKENLGFAQGNNQAMKIAKGDWLLLLNSDAYVSPNCLEKAKEFIQRHPDADMAGCKILNPDGSIQPSWGYFPTLRRLALFMSLVDNLPLIRKWIDPIHVRDISRYNEEREVDWVMGAWVMLKKEVFEKTKGFDPNYFMYGEEMEWMYRAKQMGFKIWYTPTASCIHLGGASTKSLGKAFSSEMKGYLYWWKKHYPAWQQHVLLYILKYGSWWKYLAWTIAGNKEMAEANLIASRGINAHS